MPTIAPISKLFVPVLLSTPVNSSIPSRVVAASQTGVHPLPVLADRATLGRFGGGSAAVFRVDQGVYKAVEGGVLGVVERVLECVSRLVGEGGGFHGCDQGAHELPADSGGKQVGDGVEGERAGLDDAPFEGAGEWHPIAALVLAEGIDAEALTVVSGSLIRK
ncbi:hypothetical protein [Streptomyces sp. NPDC046979]|uniref:hypothetical protein n=1 Tax=Streptomyces sp. NPDC046979 TaxID=3154604 RepID=UPI0033D4510B